MMLSVDPSSPVPLAGQIAAGVRGALIRGEVVPGERLPSARALGDSLGVNLHTVLRAYAELRDQDVIELRRGRGAVVRRGMEAEHVGLHELARTVVVEARRLGVDPAALIRAVEAVSTGARRVLVAVLGLVPAVFTAASAAWWWSALPSSLPTHWSALDRPDDFSSRTSTVTVVLSLTAAGSLIVVGACVWFHRSPVIARAMTAVGGFVTGFIAGIWLSIAASTLLAPSPDQADVGWWLVLALAAGAWSLIAVPLRTPRSTVAPEDLELDEGAPLRPVAPGEQVSWSTVIGPTWLTWATAGLLVVETAIAVAFPAVAPGAVLALVVTVLCARLEVTVDHRGLRVVAGLVRVPIKRIPLEQVVRADVEDLVAGEWGGWGYRVLPGRSAVVLRSGPALVVHLPDDRSFAVTVKDPATPAGLLNGLAAARQPR